MRNEVWQQLLALESVDIVRRWHESIHDRRLSSRRATEIVFAARQAREYFRNSANSDVTVRSLLTYYGIASLSRSALLLLKKGNGEESLASGHGLRTTDWASTLSGEVSVALGKLGSLRVQTSAGLFTDLVRETRNGICIHINSAAVEWRIGYDVPELGEELALGCLLSRIPDVSRISSAFLTTRCTPVNELTYTREAGFAAKVDSASFEAFHSIYTDRGFSLTQMGAVTSVACDAFTFDSATPQFLHTYVNKMFGAIPTLYIVEPLTAQSNYSQLAVTYALSYFLGMLTRYFPTQWISLLNGMKGDELAPSIHAAQTYVEESFPELTIELLRDTLKECGGRP